MTRRLPPSGQGPAPERPTRLVMTPTTSPSGERRLRVRRLSMRRDGRPVRPDEDPPELTFDSREAVELVERFAAVLLDGPHGFDGARDIAAGLRVLTRAWRAGLEATETTLNAAGGPRPAFDPAIPPFDLDELEPVFPGEPNDIPAPSLRFVPPGRVARQRSGRFVEMRATGVVDNAANCSSNDLESLTESEAWAYEAYLAQLEQGDRPENRELLHTSQPHEDEDYEDEDGDDEYHDEGDEDDDAELDQINADLDDDDDDYARSDEDGWFYSDDD